MPVVDTTQDDCEWIVEKSKEKLKQNDKNAARAWILTAKSLFPYRFIVQYEAFKLHLSCDELLGAAHTLVELCGRFSREEQLQQLVGQLVEEIKNGSGQVGMEQKELKQVFDALPLPSQKLILLNMAEAVSDPLQKGKIGVAALKLFPDVATTLGLDICDSLSQMSTRTNVPAAENQYRELLVTELIPLLAGSPRIIIDQPILRSSGQTLHLKTSHICQWLEMSASFFTTVTVEALMNNKPYSMAGKIAWDCLHKVFLTVAGKCNWMEIVLSKQIGPHLPSKVRWIGLEHISGYNSSSRVAFEAPRSVAIACFYISVFLFFESAWTYYSHIYQLSENGVSRCWALIEEHNPSLSMETEERPAKKRKVEDSEGHTFLNLQAGTKSGDANVIETFLVAIDCWSFIQSSNTYRGEFSRLCQQWGVTDWSWLVAFQADMALYKGEIELFRKILQRERQKIKSNDKGKLENLRFLLQLVNGYILLGDTKAACNLATELIALVPDKGPEEHSQSGKSNTIGKPTSRTLSLLECSAGDVLPYTLSIIIVNVKDIVFSDSCTDTAIGQLMVLCQYDWPKETDCFLSLISLIQKKGSFTYTKFFNYIIIIEMLEEVMYLINQTTVKINLVSQENSSRTRAVTRGVNNRVKEELTAAMDKQLTRCQESIDFVLRTFFKQERLCFIGGDE